MLWGLNNGNQRVRTERDEQTHANYGVVLSDTAGNFRYFVGGWCLGELSNLRGVTALPSIAYIHDAGYEQRWGKS